MENDVYLQYDIMFKDGEIWNNTNFVLKVSTDQWNLDKYLDLLEKCENYTKTVYKFDTILSSKLTVLTEERARILCVIPLESLLYADVLQTTQGQITYTAPQPNTTTTTAAYKHTLFTTNK